MRAFNKNKGFTLIELLLVIVIIGLLLAVIVPRAWRANIDAKYGLVRQNCSELAAFSMQWAEKALNAQDEVPPPGTDSPTLNSYISTLAASNDPSGLPNSEWIASQSGGSSWNNSVQQRIVTGRTIGGLGGIRERPEDSVEDVTPPDKIPRNPFNGVSVFEAPNDPAAGAGTPITGAIACGGVPEPSGGWYYYGLVFQGTDSTTVTLAAGSESTTFHAGQGARELRFLRNGIFMARLR